MNGDQWLDEQETWEHGIKAGFEHGFQAGYTIGYEKGKLSQKAVLDKIRAEIEKLEYLNIEDGSGGYDKYIEQYEVLKILDKAESEGKE